MTTAEKPERVTFYRLVPQIKTFPRGAVLRNKVDLFYSSAVDIVKTENEDGWNPLRTATTHISFGQNTDFICKGTNLFFVEAAQFRAADTNIYVRAHLLAGEKDVWVNILICPNRIWAFKIRDEQKKMIQAEIDKMFSIIRTPG